MGATKKIVVAVGVLCLFGGAGTMDYADALVADATEKEQRPLRVIASYETPLGHPLDWDAIVCQAGACRYYSTKRNRYADNR